jgi:hypothetical protein
MMGAKKQARVVSVCIACGSRVAFSGLPPTSAWVCNNCSAEADDADFEHPGKTLAEVFGEGGGETMSGMEREIDNEVRLIAVSLCKKYPDFQYEIAKALAEVAVRVAHAGGMRMGIDPPKKGR